MLQKIIVKFETAILSKNTKCFEYSRNLEIYTSFLYLSILSICSIQKLFVIKNHKFCNI